MKRKSIAQLLKESAGKIGAVVLASAIVLTSSMWSPTEKTYVSELTSFVDADPSMEIEEDEVPLAEAPEVTTSTSSTQSIKTVTLKKASKKTYTKKGTTKKKTKTSKKKTASATTTVKTVTVTSTVSNFKKGSKTETRVTTVTTTVTTTVVKNQTAAPTQTAVAPVTASAVQPIIVPTAQNGTFSVETAAPKVDPKVKKAFEELNFKINVNNAVTYSGYFEARKQSITMRQLDDAVYHELGHFVAFVAGNMDTTPNFKAIYESEKSLYKEFDAVYVCSSPSEYFAQSFREFTLKPAELKNSRPRTYEAVAQALSRVTDAQVAKLKMIYGAIWTF